jgi:hypothetical protein
MFEQFAMRDNDIRIPLQGIEVMTGKPVATFRWGKQDTRLFDRCINSRSG